MEKQLLYSKIYENEGKPSLLIFHGLFGLSDNWGTLGRKFAENYAVHLIDLRNHGKSFHSEEMSYTSMAQDILDYIDYYNITHPILLGHSLGGRAVMECTIKNPQLIEKLIVVDMTPKGYPPSHLAILEALNTVDFSRVHDRKDVDDMLAEKIKDKATIQFLVKNVYKNEDGLFDFRFSLKNLEKNYLDIITKPISTDSYEGPTLFISGEKSDYILKEDEPILKKQFPQEQLVVVPNAGHWVQAENPTAFYNVVISFLES